MSFTPEPLSEHLRSLDDVGTLRALANPVRQRILNHLMAFGAQTASQCATIAGATASNCSYHLRELERYDLVERASPADDGRERLWRSIPTGLRQSPATATPDPAIRAAEVALTRVELDLADQLTDAALVGWNDEPGPWREAATLSTYGLRMTAAELATLVGKLDSLIRPFIALTREAPADSEVVHLRLDAFRHPGAARPETRE